MQPNMRRAASELFKDRPPQGSQSCWFESATVSAVTAGAASDGNALCTVTWRGQAVDAAYCATYTPTVGHTVVVVVQPPASLLVIARVIGTP